jgi:hypothetical protein
VKILPKNFVPMRALQSFFRVRIADLQPLIFAMDDLIKSLKAQLYDRVTSPLLSSFLLAWVAWNHRLFVVLISSDFKGREKFAYVDEILYPHWQQVVGRGFALPLLSALFILLIYPIPSRWVYQRVRADQKRLKEIQQKFDDQTPMTIAEARELRVAIRKAEEIADAKDKIIGDLRSTVATQEKIIRDATTTAVSDPVVRPQLNQRQSNILALISENGTVGLQQLQLRSAEPSVVVEHEVDEMMAENLLDEGEGSGDRYLKITPEGRSYLVQYAASLIGKFGAIEMDRKNIDS